MAKVTIRRGNDEFEVSDLTFEQVKELVGVNGYGAHGPKQSASTPVAAQPQLIPPRDDYAGFLNSVSHRGRLFLEILGHHPEGIEANTLAGKLGFKDARQIGGLTGAGIARLAKKHGVKIKDIYRAEITFPANKRTVTFYPGKIVLAINEEKPAV
jgi:hypothetical protein